MLKYIEGKGSVQVALTLITMTAYALSLFTPSVNPWLYLPSNPIPSYTPVIYESYLVSETITSRYASGSLYVELVYLVPVWYSSFTHGIAILQVS